MNGIKICGIRDSETLALCDELNVEWAGFVFYSASPRAVTAQNAADISSSVLSSAEGGPKRVGLFVKADDDTIAQTLEALPLDVLQIYDTTERALDIQTRFGLPVWEARGIATRKNLPTDARLDGYVVEAPKQANDDRPGGLGRTIDWTITSGWRAPTFWMLAGGLNSENVERAIQTSGADAVDVSSGVEAAPGRKSAHLIEKFVRNARRGLDLRENLP